MLPFCAQESPQHGLAVRGCPELPTPTPCPPQGLILHRGCPTWVCVGQAGRTTLCVWTSRGHPDGGTVV